VSELLAYEEATSTCTRCPLAATRTQVVFGSGDPDADLMFVGEAPGFHEDKNGVPFVGQAGKLLEQLLNGIGLSRTDVYIANVLKCLRYDALVQLGDGSWERIGRLVRSKYGGKVMSIDDDGNLVPRQVTGWHATPLGDRRVFRLTYQSAKRAGLGKTSVHLTGDHPVLTERGYVRADELEPTDRVATGQGLSALAYDVVCGTLLGDGTISSASASLSFSHSAKQSAYADFKAELLTELRPCRASFRVAAVAGGTASYDVVQVRTLASRALGVLRREFYGAQKRVPAWIAYRLTPRMLAVWFMDDGHTRIRSGRRPLAEIATVSFAETDLRILQQGLLRLGLPTKALRGRLYFDVPATRALSETIAPYVPPAMRYKLDPEVERRVPFDPGRFSIGPADVLYDEVDIEDVTERTRTDTTFFCIDVEETHNFVTAGGVVHNCRPPGNRDPQPEEIEACESHLFHQIELIQPTLVATLGNFATKLLSGKPMGITKVHGVAQQVALGGNEVTLYPLFHPAAALYTRSMLSVLEQDFLRIPELLGLTTVVPEPAVFELVPEAEPERPLEPAVQLGLF
jgi:uracil-DNA glycosylase family 4